VRAFQVAEDQPAVVSFKDRLAGNKLCEPLGSATPWLLNKRAGEPAPLRAEIASRWSFAPIVSTLGGYAGQPLLLPIARKGNVADSISHALDVSSRGLHEALGEKNRPSCWKEYEYNLEVMRDYSRDNFVVNLHNWENC